MGLPVATISHYPSNRLNCEGTRLPPPLPLNRLHAPNGWLRHISGTRTGADLERPGGAGNGTGVACARDLEPRINQGGVIGSDVCQELDSTRAGADTGVGGMG